MDPNSKPRKPGPEARAWDKLKGKVVLLGFRDGSDARCTLVWVDYHTVGVQWHLPELADCTGEHIVFKSDLRRVCLAK